MFLVCVSSDGWYLGGVSSIRYQLRGRELIDVLVATMDSHATVIKTASEDLAETWL